MKNLYKIILFFSIVFFFGCENKDNFKELVQKLQKEKNSLKNIVLKESLDEPLSFEELNKKYLTELNQVDENNSSEAKKLEKKQANKEIKTNAKEANKKEPKDNNEEKNTKKQETLKKDLSKKQKLVNKENTPIVKTKENLVLKTVSGKTLKVKFIEDGILFDKYKGKVLILDIFTTWCPPCLESIDHLNKIYKKYKDKVQIVGILMEENRRDSEILEFKQKHHILYPITNSKENFELVNTWGGVNGYPTIIIFDKNGKYFNHFSGAPPYEMLLNDIKKVLRKK